MTFIPVKEERKTKDIKLEIDKFPQHPVITLKGYPQKGNKILKMNPKAQELLGLEVNNPKCRVGILKGYDSPEKLEEKYFVYVTEDEKIEYVNDKKNKVGKDSSKINLNTLKFKSSWIYNELSAYHNEKDDTKNRYFLLEVTSDKNYYKLVEIESELMDVQIIPSDVEVEQNEEEDSQFETKGANTDVEIQ